MYLDQKISPSLISIPRIWVLLFFYYLIISDSFYTQTQGIVWCLWLSIMSGLQCSLASGSFFLDPTLMCRHSDLFWRGSQGCVSGPLLCHGLSRPEHWDLQPPTHFPLSRWQAKSGLCKTIKIESKTKHKLCIPGLLREQKREWKHLLSEERKTPVYLTTTTKKNHLRLIQKE